jgi:hypothetical protein
MPTKGKKKHPGGAPPVITPEVLQKLEQAFSIGCTDEEACDFADIADRTLYYYQEKHPEFLQRKQRLKRKPILKARLSVVNGLTKDSALALRFLERVRRDEFGTKQFNEHQGEGGGPIQLTVVSSIPRPNYETHKPNKRD